MTPNLDIFIGSWITEGTTADTPSVPVVASDVYEWAPGGKYVVHSAHGRIGDTDVGGIEIIRADPDTGTYRTHFFDVHGSLTTEELRVRDGAWIWQGETVRCTGLFSDDGRLLTAHHERMDDGHWVPAMDVTLSKVAVS